MLRNLLILSALFLFMLSCHGCAALWVADTAVDTAVFAGKTTARAGVAAAELTWDAGEAAVGVASGEASGENDDSGNAGRPDN